MANVELIEYTGKGSVNQMWHAAHLLIFTKSTRLNMDGDLMTHIMEMTESELREQLDYMANTIPSSWEFVDMTFLIKGVSRATAQQITRTRTASFAMQSLRVVDASDIGVVNPFPGDNAYGPGEHSDEDSKRWSSFDLGIEESLQCYRDLIAHGAAAQDARGILPLNTECNLVAKYNLRSFVDLIKARSSLRVQGEYSDIADQMKSHVLAVWPWAEKFFQDPNDKAIALLEKVAEEVGITTGKGPGWDIAKAIDLIRKG